MNKNDIRIDDTVEVKFKAKVTGKLSDMAEFDIRFLNINHTLMYVPYELITDVIARAETDAEKSHS
jgi:hypothetical protein